MDKITHLTDKELSEKRENLQKLSEELNLNENPTDEDVDKMKDYCRQIEEIEAEKARRARVNETKRCFDTIMNKSTERTAEQRSEHLINPEISQNMNGGDEWTQNLVSSMYQQRADSMPQRCTLLMPNRVGASACLRSESLGSNSREAKEARDILQAAVHIAKKCGMHPKYASKAELRAETFGTMTANPDIIPNTVSDEIVAQALVHSPVISMSDVMYKSGTVTVIKEDITEDDITLFKAKELEPVDSHIGKYSKLTLDGTTLRASAACSRDLINEAEIPFMTNVVRRMAEKFKYEFEWTLSHPDKYNMDNAENFGFNGVQIEVSSRGNQEITQQDLIDLIEAVPAPYDEKGVFLVNRATYFRLVRLENSVGDLQLIKDPLNTKPTLVYLGHPIIPVAGIPNVEANAYPVYFGDLSGLIVKISRDLEIEVEKDLKRDAYEVHGFLRFDARIKEPFKFSKLKMKE